MTPRDAPGSAAQTETQVTLRRGRRDASGDEDRRILLVEDDLDARLLVDSALHEVGFAGDLDVETDGQAALERVADGVGSWDLVLLDLSLPNAGGLEILSAIRTQADRSSLPVVVLTNVDDDATVRQAYDLGANCWIRKPRHFAELKDALGGVLSLLAHTPLGT